MARRSVDQRAAAHLACYRWRECIRCTERQATQSTRAVERRISREREQQHCSGLQVGVAVAVEAVLAAVAAMTAVAAVAAMTAVAAVVVLAAVAAVVVLAALAAMVRP